MKEEFNIPLLLLIFYSLDIITSFLLDPTLTQLEQNPLARKFGWAYGIGVSVLFIAALSVAWIWASKKLSLLKNAKAKWWRQWFVWVFAREGAPMRWAVAFGRILPPASIAMKAVLAANNIIFFVLIRLMTHGQTDSLMGALGYGGRTPHYFYRMVFGAIMGFALACGIVAAAYVFRKDYVSLHGKR